MSLSVRRLAPALLFALTLPAALQAAIYIPNKTADTNDGACDSDCSLREAITAANQNPGEDVILLHAGTYTLTASGPANGNLQIQGDTVLIGDGAGRTIIDGGAGGIFFIPNGVTVQMQDVTLRNGRSPGAGGAIRNNGDLTLLRTILTGNSSVAGSVGSGLGGAIVSDGTNPSLTIVDSTISNNTAQGAGGGIAAGGDVTLTNVTVSGNRTTADLGGGVYFFTSIRGTVNNSTIAGNTAAVKGGGILVETALFIGVSPKVTNSIIAGNTAPAGPDCGGAIDSSYNLIGKGTDCAGPSAANHDKVGTAASPLDPKLGPLAGNGGPTPTLALLAGSPAIDAGNPSPPGSGTGACEATDQRGARRPGGTTCDIGAFEATAACVAGGNTLCLNNGRFKVTANWQTSNASGAGTAVTLTGDSGYFWFFDAGNVEVVAKVLNACGVNNRYWFFAAGLTDQKVDLTVTDTQTGQVKTYTSPLKQTFRTITDTGAFATCP
ncbi:MAG TPA: CSLREA domain-containing protein [Thermoanaerobaculia bacterium]|nr:CSLREA domain-containing protein [Thermoanaerobaculia bacterium]